MPDPYKILVLITVIAAIVVSFRLSGSSSPGERRVRAIWRDAAEAFGLRFVDGHPKLMARMEGVYRGVDVVLSYRIHRHGFDTQLHALCAVRLPEGFSLAPASLRRAVQAQPGRDPEAARRLMAHEAVQRALAAMAEDGDLHPQLDQEGLLCVADHRLEDPRDLRRWLDRAADLMAALGAAQGEGAR